MAERVALYSYVPPPGENIPIYIKPLLVDDLVPEEDKVEWSVKRLYNNRSGGMSGMRADHLKWWLATAWKAEKDMETAGKEEAATTIEGGGQRLQRRKRGQIWTTGRGSWTSSSRRSGRGSLRRRQRGRRWS